MELSTHSCLAQLEMVKEFETINIVLFTSQQSRAKSF